MLHEPHSQLRFVALVRRVLNDHWIRATKKGYKRIEGNRPSGDTN